MTSASAPPVTAKQLGGMVLAVLSFWLFSGTGGSLAGALLREISGDVRSPSGTSLVNVAVPLTSAIAAVTVVWCGRRADRRGQIHVLQVGNLVGVLGSLLAAAAQSGVAVPLLLAGRALQGLSAGFVLPATLGLIRSTFDGASRQRPVSLWSLGAWGGGGFAFLVGAAVADGVVPGVGWRAVFLASALVSLSALLLLRGAVDIPGRRRRPRRPARPKPLP